MLNASTHGTRMVKAKLLLSILAYREALIEIEVCGNTANDNARSILNSQS